MTPKRFSPRIDFRDPSAIFGSEIAEDENDEIFLSYAMKRPEVQDFCDPKVGIRLICAYKGEGKSALLRLARSELESQHPDAIILQKFAPDFSPALESDNYDEWVRGWKRSIIAVAAGEIGSRIGFAWDDDGMTLVEIAERDGFKKRSFVSAVIDRINAKIPVKKSARHRPVDPGSPLLERWLREPPGIWLFIDDVDRNFQNSMRHMVKIAALFEACRHLWVAIPNMRFRASIRPNTWAMLYPVFESLSHIGQYQITIRWSEAQVLELLGLRVEGYLRRTAQLEETVKAWDIPSSGPERYKGLISMAFETPVQWGANQRPIHVPLYTLAQKRPRWVINACRAAASIADRREHQKILFSDVSDMMPGYSEQRLFDIEAEFRPQCPEISEVVDAFRDAYDHMRTDELLTLIQNKICEHVPVKILGRSAGARDVASLLFETGLICGRRDFSDDGYEHIYFADQPTLFRSRSNVDNGYTWEIPPAFRTALGTRARKDFVPSKVAREERPKRRIVRP